MLIEYDVYKHQIDESNTYRHFWDKKRVLTALFPSLSGRAKAKECGITRTLTSSFDVTPREGSESTNMGLEPTAFR